MSLGQQLIDKLTSRNFAAVSTISTFLGIIAYIITRNPELVENPIVTGILGSFTTVVVLVYQFYFRTSGPAPTPE